LKHLEQNQVTLLVGEQSLELLFLRAREVLYFMLSAFVVYEQRLNQLHFNEFLELCAHLVRGLEDYLDVALLAGLLLGVPVLAPVDRELGVLLGESLEDGLGLGGGAADLGQAQQVFGFVGRGRDREVAAFLLVQLLPELDVRTLHALDVGNALFLELQALGEHLDLVEDLLLDTLAFQCALLELQCVEDEPVVPAEWVVQFCGVVGREH